jgi:hypothetical protein
MRFIWIQSRDKVKRFTISGFYRKTEIVERGRKRYCMGLGSFYCGQLPLEIVDIEGRERAKKSSRL